MHSHALSVDTELSTRYSIPCEPGMHSRNAMPNRARLSQAMQTSVMVIVTVFETIAFVIPKHRSAIRSGIMTMRVLPSVNRPLSVLA